MRYIYQDNSWPDFRWDSNEILSLLSEVRNRQGRIIGKMASIGFELQNEALLNTLTQEVVKSTEIEGESLDESQVRSSVAVRLGLDIAGISSSDRYIDGIVEMMFDATNNFNNVLTEDRLFGWHCALFPTQRSGIHKIITGNWRDDSNGPMQVVSGAFGRLKIHFQAPDAPELSREMTEFIRWINETTDVEPVLKAAIAHLWFVTLHPFDDGNGRIARAVTEMLLARSDGIPQRFYSMSAQIQKERKKYYNILEVTQKGGLDITEWLRWFLDCLLKALDFSEGELSQVIQKHTFWSANSAKIKNERQQLVLSRILGDFKGKITTSKWAKLAKCSNDTALRDIQYLESHGILIKQESGGRSTHYTINLSQ